jgi:hypothetical protein
MIGAVKRGTTNSTEAGASRCGARTARRAVIYLRILYPCNPYHYKKESRSFARIFSPRSLRLCARLGKRGNLVAAGRAVFILHFSEIRGNILAVSTS